MSNELLFLYDLAENEDIEIDCMEFNSLSAMTLRTADGRYHIAIDPFQLQSSEDELCKLCHEMGHCQTGSVYTRMSPWDLRSRHEKRADKWAVHRLIPIESCKKALQSGCKELWQLAEYFGVTEEFAGKAIEIYRQENLLPT